jgi:hypothetical protein
MGRSTCASVSALSLDAQPAQLDRLVRRIWRPEGGFLSINPLSTHDVPIILSEAKDLPL